MAQPENKPDFEKIREAAAYIKAVYGGKLYVKEWESGNAKILKVTLLWEVKDRQTQAA